MFLTRLASNNQQLVSFTLNNQAEKNLRQSSKTALLASNLFFQEFFEILLPKYSVMFSSPEVQFQYLQQFGKI